MQRYDYGALSDYASNLFAAAGMDQDKAVIVAQVLLEADLMGHRTHGLALAPWYVTALADGAMTGTGEQEIVSDRGACVTWNGRRLPGTWLTRKAVELGVERAAQYGVVTISIAEAHHTGALAAYLTAATEKGFIAYINCSTTSVAAVAPFGGTKSVFTPNPLAMGIPTEADPILIDVSSSIATLNMARTLVREEARFAGPWVLDAQGNATDDPAAVVSGGGSLLPLGGVEYGHKGYGLALMIEALSNGLSGFGRRNGPESTCLSVFVQIIDPEAFGGRDALLAETSYLAEQCRSNPPRQGVDAVRLPGDGALARKRDALDKGVLLSTEIVTGLINAGARYSLDATLFA